MDTISKIMKEISFRDPPRKCRRCGTRLRVTMMGTLKCFKCGKIY